MAKQGKTRDPENTARRKLADSQAKLHSAQERRTRAVADGDIKLETTRQRVNRKIEQATKTVERRAAKVARAEGRLLTLQHRQVEARLAEKAGRPMKAKKSKALTGVMPDASQPTAPTAVADHLETLEAAASDSNGDILPSHDAATESPEAAADHLADLVEIAAENRAADDVVTLDAPGATAAATASAELDQYEQQLLAVLRDEFSATGATFTDWLAIAGMSKRTFLRARKTLVEAGLAERRGTGQGARYFVTAVG